MKMIVPQPRMIELRGGCGVGRCTTLLGKYPKGNLDYVSAQFGTCHYEFIKSNVVECGQIRNSVGSLFDQNNVGSYQTHITVSF